MEALRVNEAGGTLFLLARYQAHDVRGYCVIALSNVDTCTIVCYYSDYGVASDRFDACVSEAGK